MKYVIEYSPETEEHFRVLTAREQRIVLDGVERQLRYQPDVETHHRKPMRPNPLAPWELRVGNLRVYYEIEYDPEPAVWIAAVGKKEGNCVIIGKEVVVL